MPLFEQIPQKFLFASVLIVRMLLQTLLQILIRSQLSTWFIDHFQRKIPQNPVKLTLRNGLIQYFSLSAYHRQLIYTIFVDRAKGVVKYDIADQKVHEEDLAIIRWIFFNRAEAFSIDYPNIHTISQDRLTPYFYALGARRSRRAGLKSWVVEEQRVDEKRLPASEIPTDGDEAIVTMISLHMLDGLLIYYKF